MNGITAPSLPGYVLGPSIAIYAVLVLFLAIRCRSVAGAFVLIAIAIRLAMSAAPFVSFTSSGLGLSWNALASCLVIGAGGLIIRRGPILSWVLPPVTALMFVIVVSGVINDSVPESIEAILKYGYFTILALTVYDACEAEGFGTFLGKAAIILMLPLVLQFESLALGVAKAGEADGSASYIGGYNHEASFSLLLMSALLVVAMNQRLSIRTQLLVAALCVSGVLLANYRTAIGAIAPMLVALTLVNGMRNVVRSQQLYALAAASLIVLGLLPIALSLFSERFETLVLLLQNPGLPFKDPGAFTFEERKVMSGRALIWANYFDVWRSLPPLQAVIGLGADSWEDYFALYAHNTLISTLFEYGVVGVILMLVLWLWMLVISWRCDPPISWILVASHIGFILLNMATMPFWMIEGLVFYGLLCGTSMFLFDSKRKLVMAKNRPEPSDGPAKMGWARRDERPQNNRISGPRSTTAKQ